MYSSTTNNKKPSSVYWCNSDVKTNARAAMAGGILDVIDQSRTMSFQMSLDTALSSLHQQWVLLQDQQLIRPGGSVDQLRTAIRLASQRDSGSMDQLIIDFKK